MNPRTVGISDISVYVPEQRMDLVSLAAYRVRTIPNLARHFERALRTTGQRAIRFPRPWEDSATMAATAAAQLLERRRTASGQQTLSGLRYLVAGTETGVDHSKPVSAYVQGMLGLAGFNLPETLASYQLQHACAGATAGLITTGALLALSGNPNEFGIVTASDIARYEGKSTAEVTQGSGAAAILVEPNPKLLELDLASPGYYSQDVDDFFRPVGSITAKVKGQYSMQCYKINLDGALRDFAGRHDTSVKDILLGTDYFVLHAPFRNMPGMALEKMFEEHAGMTIAEARAHLARGGFYSAIEPIAESGNSYTASVYINLASLLIERYREEGEKIIGKSILIASYGSGNTMILIGAKVTSDAPAVIASWPHELIGRGRRATIRDYELWMAGPEIESEIAEPDAESVQNETGASSDQPPKAFYLANIRNDGYREYLYGAPVTAGAAEANEVSASVASHAAN
ncbi:MAG TPA: hydroxymethylglutaryl-CoA synthase [Spirochaetia bacterium]|nr:hydroxymethylglutaryl-CoA synthase [Spirochaetia bacterium]